MTDKDFSLTGYYEEQIKAADEEKYPGQTWDQTALSQSTYGSTLMHTSIPSVVDLHRKNVLDLGCGTGTMYETLVVEGVHPKSVHGVDLMPKFGERFLDKTKGAGIESTFEVKGEELRFTNPNLVEAWADQHYDAVVMIGIVGFYGDHEFGYLYDLYAAGRMLAEHGAISFPMIYGSGCYAQKELTRYAVEDVKRFITPSVKTLEREAIIYW